MWRPQAADSALTDASRSAALGKINKRNYHIFAPVNLKKILTRETHFKLQKMESVVGLLHTIVATAVSSSCADTLILDGDVFDQGCLRLCLSKALGYGVVLGATIGI